MGKQEQYVIIFLHLGNRAAERTKPRHLKPNLEVDLGVAGLGPRTPPQAPGLVWFCFGGA